MEARLPRRTHDLLLLLLDAARVLRDPRLHTDQCVLASVSRASASLNFSRSSFFLILQRLFLCILGLDLRMDHIGTAAIMLIVHPGRVDLLFQDIDLAFQLLLQEIGLP